ncbi:MAG: hypothetical protein AAGA80_07745 [Cyanobacteria bacterium P01_F01_bin.143]
MATQQLKFSSIIKFLYNLPCGTNGVQKVLGVFSSVIIAETLIVDGLKISVLIIVFLLLYHFTVSLLETILRGGLPTRAHYDVFISYQFSQHKEIAKEVYAFLNSQGLKVLLYETQEIKDCKSIFPASEWALTNLPEKLKNALKDSSCILFLVPEEEQKTVKSLSFFLSHFIKKMVNLLTCINPLNHLLRLQHQILNHYKQLWYQKFYGVDLERKLGETWQFWEIRVGREMGRLVIPVAIADSETHQNNNLPFLRREHLAEDLRHIVKRIKDESPKERRLEFLPNSQPTFVCIVIIIPIVALILIFTSLLLWIVDLVIAIITSIFVII